MSASPDTPADPSALASWRGWWANLRIHHRGSQAALRRAHTIADAAAVRATVDRFYRHCDADPWFQPTVANLERVAFAACLVVHIKQDSQRSLGRALGGRDPVLSELRLRRLIATTDLDELLPVLRRAVSMCGPVSVDAVGAFALAITSPREPDRRRARTRLALQYYDAPSK